MPEERPSAQLARLVNGYQVSQAIHAAATLGIADLLADGPRTSDDLAMTTGAHAPSLYRLLRALASAGVFREEEGRQFSLTPVGECLRSGAAEPVGPWAAFIGRESYWRSWGELLHSVRTGENAFRHLHGTDVWSYRAERPDESAIFDAAMSANSRRGADAVLAAYDFSGFGCVIDVGGGQGALLASVLAANPSVQGVLFDQPHVVARAEATLAAAGVADRCRVEGGSFFEAVPSGGDAIMMRQIIHDWYDPEAAAILRVCRQAIKPDGRLLIIESVIGAPNEAPEAKFMDLNMLVAPGGQERTREEFETLFAVAGFRLSEVIRTASPASIVVGLPV